MSGETLADLIRCWLAYARLSDLVARQPRRMQTIVFRDLESVAWGCSPHNKTELRIDARRDPGKSRHPLKATGSHHRGDSRNSAIASEELPPSMESYRVLLSAMGGRSATAPLFHEMSAMSGSLVSQGISDQFAIRNHSCFAHRSISTSGKLAKVREVDESELP